MRCPACGADEDRVVDSRSAENGHAVRRRRECVACAARFTTFERAELPELIVRKRSGATVPFRREKVLEGMSRAAKNHTKDDLAEHAWRVERRLRSLGSRVVSSEQVGLEVLAQLRDIDPVAYMRFASVYKDFQGPEDFETELHSLRKAEPPKARQAS